MGKYTKKVRCEACGSRIQISATGISECPKCKASITPEGIKTSETINMPSAKIINIVSQQIRANMADVYFLGNDFSKSEDDLGLLGDFARHIAIRQYNDNEFELQLYCSRFEEKYCSEHLLACLGLPVNEKDMEHISKALYTLLLESEKQASIGPRYVAFNVAGSGYIYDRLAEGENKLYEDSRSFAQTEARCNCLNAGHPYQNAVSYETLRLSVYSFNAILALDGKKVGESSYDEIAKALENHFGFKLWKWFDGDDAYYIVLNKSTNETYPIPY